MSTNLRQSDRELIFDLAHKLTGTMEAKSTRHEIVITNVLRRMSQVNRPNLVAYLNYVAENEDELSHFISAVTIHTTAWFREMPHYKRMETNLSLTPSKLPGRKIRLLSAACSTGEELYSFGMILETFRKQYAGFDYELVGFDVDPICVQRADAGFYHINDLSSIPQVYHHFLVPSKNGENNYIVDEAIRSRASFHVGNLLDQESIVQDPFDFVFCRNVLIYFSEEKVNSIITHLLPLVKKDGILTLGHSETVDTKLFGLIAQGESTYRRAEETLSSPTREKPITVLSVDDSSWVRMWLATKLAEHNIKVITASSTEAADELMSRNKFDLITLDLNVPGKTSPRDWLKGLRLTGHQTPVIILTESSVEQAPEILEALSGSSQDFVNKRLLEKNSQEFVDQIQSIVKATRARKNSDSNHSALDEVRSRAPVRLARPDLILIGASTGGTDALCQVLERMPKDCPPIVVVQHIPHEFASAFLERLARASGLTPVSPDKIKELAPGHIYLSTQDAHIGVRSLADKVQIYYSQSEKMSGHRPSVDYLFQTASFVRNKRILACLLTGMGKDGAQGLLELKRNGAMTLAQDERSSVVWGMPGEAVKLGAPMFVGNLKELHEVVMQALKEPPIKKVG